MIEFKCQGCGTRVRVSDDNAGKKGRCPQCKAIVQIPHVAAASETPRRMAHQGARAAPAYAANAAHPMPYNSQESRRPTRRSPQQGRAHAVPWFAGYGPGTKIAFGAAALVLLGLIFYGFWAFVLRDASGEDNGTRPETVGRANDGATPNGFDAEQKQALEAQVKAAKEQAEALSRELASIKDQHASCSERENQLRDRAKVLDAQVTTLKEQVKALSGKPEPDPPPIKPRREQILVETLASLSEMARLLKTVRNETSLAAALPRLRTVTARIAELDAQKKHTQEVLSVGIALAVEFRRLEQENPQLLKRIQDEIKPPDKLPKPEPKPKQEYPTFVPKDPRTALQTPIGVLESATFTTNASIYMYDRKASIPGIKVVSPYLIVRFRTRAAVFGPWSADDYSVVGGGSKAYNASMVDIGDEGFWWVNDRGSPVTSFGNMPRTKGDESVVVLAFHPKAVSPTAKRFTLKYKSNRVVMVVAATTKRVGAGAKGGPAPNPPRTEGTKKATVVPISPGRYKLSWKVYKIFLGPAGILTDTGRDDEVEVFRSGDTILLKIAGDKYFGGKTSRITARGGFIEFAGTYSNDPDLKFRGTLKNGKVTGTMIGKIGGQTGKLGSSEPWTFTLAPAK